MSQKSCHHSGENSPTLIDFNNPVTCRLSRKKYTIYNKVIVLPDVK